jgi:peptidoglycan hydrolase CwlO-like protein
MDHYKIRFYVSQTLIGINCNGSRTRPRCRIWARASYSRTIQGDQDGGADSRRFLLLWLAEAKPPARQKKYPNPQSPEIAEKQADLGELRSRIESLRKDLNASEENKADAGDRLRESERKISRLQRELLELGEQRGQLQKKLQKP